jgi:hypothetical protein
MGYEEMVKIAVVIALMVIAGSVYGQQKCTRVDYNLQGVDKADVDVDNTSGGTIVALANPLRCTLLLENTGANVAYCAPTINQLNIVDGSTGKLLQASATPGTVSGGQMGISNEATQEWRCFSTAGTTVNAIEGLP